ncbi:hypothetical protein CDL15_Pgr011359 [Punica granatum]|uniref:UDP-glucuronate decarboxylase n=1 Tax=Punica granatum TaxID=22663 RepID=A0A218WGT3_PUNGR|nr:hypothetical protein CDL15_Pgr011359 [Punica granatum]PKI65089.1 hypothetical protein CRG98_014558 [Punica granatum]
MASSASSSSELIQRNHHITQTPASASSHSSPFTSSDQPSKTSGPAASMLLQRALFLLVGVAIAALFFHAVPASSPKPDLSSPVRRATYEVASEAVESGTVSAILGADQRVNFGGKVPLGLKRKGLRIVVTGGAGFVGSHLVDRLISRGDSVIVVDNFFTGRKENLVHHFGNPRFELIRHDVVEPILLEVDQIYHLACPASPVHYKFNPVKTIISF